MTLILVPTAFEAKQIFGVAPANAAELIELNNSFALALCGFGLAASGSGASYAIQRFNSLHSALPANIYLTGIAGSYNLATTPLGSVVYPDSCACHGIGKGTAEDFVSAEQMGWKQGLPLVDDQAAGDLLPIRIKDSANEEGSTLIVSVAAASKSLADAEHVLSRYPMASLEDMETFSVALACRLYGIELTVVRAVSNAVGEPFERWQTESAFDALRRFTINELKLTGSL
jgi:futalosine hydrolase